MNIQRLRRFFIGTALVIAAVVSSVTSATTLDLAAYTALRQAPLSPGQRRLASSLRAVAALVAQQGAAAVGRTVPRTWRLSDDGVVDVYVYTDVLTQTEIDTLRNHSVQLYHAEPQWRIVYAAVAIDALETIATLPFVRWVSLPSYSVLRKGSVTSEGDTILRAAEARATFGIDGRGVRIGIISDSLVHLQESVDTGDLPPDVVILKEADPLSPIDTTDEGRAMAEIIHDLAPGATLLFHSGFSTALDMSEAIRNLVDAGAHVIVDDIGFFSEPAFEHGPVAQAVQEAIDHGVVYVTAAGNAAMRHYRGMYKEFDPNDGDPENNLHDFGQGDASMAVMINPGERFAAWLQWPAPFDGSANTANYDLLVFDADGRALACDQPGLSGLCASTEDQLAVPAPPIETVFVDNNTGQAVTVTLVINRVTGPALPLVLTFNRAGRLLEHNVPGGSVFGHPCVREALAVGAISASDAGFNTLEPFSSRGPCELFFPAFTVHTKPDVVAADGVQTSLSGFRPFLGTSAAAPHVAGIVALLIDATGGPGELSNTQLADIIRLSARDREAPEHDNTSGHGAVDAVAAVLLWHEVLAGNNGPPQSTIDTPAADVSVAPGASVIFQGACRDADNNGPVKGTWDFGGVAAVSRRRTIDIDFLEPGVFPIAFTCADADGAADPSPATRTVTVNRPPDSTILAPVPGSTVAAGSSVDFAGACDDTESDTPFTFLWFFGGGAEMASSTQQNPRDVRFTTTGTFVVTFICTDARGMSDPRPTTLELQVVADAGLGLGGGGGGGGGCSMISSAPQSPSQFVAGCGNVVLPVVVLLVIHVWSRARRR